MIRETISELHRVLRPAVEEIILHPDTLQFSAASAEFGFRHGVLIMVRPHRSDYGRLIGKDGVRFDGLNHLAQRIGQLNDAEVKLDLQRSNFGAPGERQAGWNLDWPSLGDRIRVVTIAAQLARTLFRGEEPTLLMEDSPNSKYSQLIVWVSIGESVENMRKHYESLRAIVDAMGRKHGRNVSTVVRQELEPIPDPQPRSAGGRFVKEIPR